MASQASEDGVLGSGDVIELALEASISLLITLLRSLLLINFSSPVISHLVRWKYEFRSQLFFL